ncbi:hypothetical protein GCM10023194_05890 [Planotetraspora phitsanulokensis]|uniref:Uncharacterized protein n=1 Tax=Planotetraspora phitsanulokensis TaxID=575192 RepID=A0A8J3U6I8_9ACTN|nr:hypothetical protein [Planotetraspora phitsanulokensis]GII39085.1 hypothetical protein Pph01_40880 [Planotetraspora phitsanulokensis]
MSEADGTTASDAPRRRPAVVWRVALVLGVWGLFGVLITYMYLDELINRDSYDHGNSSYRVPFLNFPAALVATVTTLVIAYLVFRGATKDQPRTLRLLAWAVGASVVLGLAALVVRPEGITFFMAASAVIGLVTAYSADVRDWCRW